MINVINGVYIYVVVLHPCRNQSPAAPQKPHPQRLIWRFQMQNVCRRMRRCLLLLQPSPVQSSQILCMQLAFSDLGASAATACFKEREEMERIAGRCCMVPPLIQELQQQWHALKKGKKVERMCRCWMLHSAAVGLHAPVARH